MTRKLEHATHNYELFRHLKQIGSYNDWVIVVAFYAAIHFVDHLIFPCNLEDPTDGKKRQFYTFEQYLKALGRAYRRKRRVIPHEVRLKIVDNYHDEKLKNSFTILKTRRKTYNYLNWEVNSAHYKECVNAIEYIRSKCQRSPS